VGLVVQVPRAAKAQEVSQGPVEAVFLPVARARPVAAPEVVPAVLPLEVKARGEWGPVGTDPAAGQLAKPKARVAARRAH